MSDRLLSKHPRLKAWMWFVLLWLGGLCASFLLAYIVKVIFKVVA